MPRTTPQLTDATVALQPCHELSIGSVRGAQPIAWVALGLACLLVGACLKLPEAVQSPGSDTGMFATYGTMLLHGARPYVDFWDLHPPVVFAYWALLEAIAGSDWLKPCLSADLFVPHSCTGLAAHGLDLSLSVAAALIVAGIARRAGSSAATAALAALLVVGFSDQSMISQEGSNPSKLTLLPSSLAIWLYLGSRGDRSDWRSALAAGAAAGVAGLAKQPALLTLVALVGHAAWRRDPRGLAGLVCGAGVTLAIGCVVLAAVGSFDGFVTQVWGYNIERVFTGYFVHPAKAPTIGLNRVLTESAGSLAVAGVIGTLVLARAPLRSTQAVVVYWTAVNIIAVTALREFVYVVPCLAVVGALGFERIWQSQGFRLGWLERGLLLAFCVAGILATTSFQRGQFVRARLERGMPGALTPTEELGWIFRRDLPPGPLFIYGNGAEMYALADRVPATRYLNAEALRSTAPGVAITRAELVGSLENNSPPIIALAPHSDETELNLAEYPSMRAFLETCYTPMPIRPDIDARWTILVRTGVCGPD